MNKRTLFLITAGIAILGLAAGLFGIPLLERAKTEEVTRFLSDLPVKAQVDGVDVNVLRGTVTLHNLRIESPYAVTTIRTLTLAGLNADATEKSGVTALADRLEADGYRVQAAGTPESLFLCFGYLEIAADRIEGEGVTGDARALIASFDPQTDLNEAMRAAASLRFEKKITRGFRTVSPLEDETDVFITTAEYVEETDTGSFRSGSSLIRNFELTYAGDDDAPAPPALRFIAAEGRTGAIWMPGPVWNLATRSVEFDTSGSAASPQGLFGLRNGVLQDIRLEFMGTTLFRLPSFTLEAVVSPSEITFMADAPDIVFPRAALEAFLPEYAGLLPDDGEEQHVSLKSEVTTEREGDAATRFTFDAHAGLAHLGSAGYRLIISGKGPGSVIPIDTATPAFVSLELNLDDRGLIDRLLSADPDAAEGKSVSERRAELRQSVLTDMSAYMSLFGDIFPEKRERAATAFQALADFCATPGELRLTLRSDPPLPLLSLFILPSDRIADHLTPSGEFTPHAP